MTVENTNPIQHFTANGETTTFAINFSVEGKSNLKVTANSLTISVNEYSYDVLTNSVVFNVAPVLDTEIAIERITTLERSINYQTYDNSFRPETLNYDLDRIWHVLQEDHITDAEILARIKDEIEWRKSHDTEFDLLAQAREGNLFNALKSYMDTIGAMSVPNLFDGITDNVVITEDGVSQRITNRGVKQSIADLEQALNDAVEASASSVDAERVRAISVEASLTTQITDETSRAIGIEQSLQTQVNSLGVGNKAYKTYADMTADTLNIPAKSKVTVTNDADTTQNGDYQFDGTTFTKSIYDPLVQAKAYADANKVFKPSIISTSIDFNTLKTYGLYTFVSGTVWNDSTNRPNYTNQWGQLFVFPVSTTVVSQLVICMNAKTFAMRLCDSANVWTAWTYHSDDAALTSSIENLVKTSIKNYTVPVYESKSVNRLDPNNLLTGYEIHLTSGLIAQSDSVTSNLIDVKGSSAVTVSGLQDNTQIGRLYRFLDSNGNTLSTASIGVVNEKVITVPTDAVWFQISIKQRNPSALNISTAQVEIGNTKTSYSSFIRGDIIGIHGSHIKQNTLNIGYAALGKNLLNTSTLLFGVEIYGTGALLNQSQSVTTALINVQGIQEITLSGLQPNPEIPRYYRFLDENEALISKAQIPNPNSNYTITVPVNSKYFQVSLLQRTTTVLDTSSTQIESGAYHTAYETYKAGVSALNGIDIIKGGCFTSTVTNTSKAYGAKYLIFGDSITQTSDVDNGSVDSSTWFTNWASYAKDQLKMSDFKNYAKSGAAFREYGQTNQWQMISHQINTAIANNETPDVIVIACGTNDAGVNLGDYDTALNKTSLTDLNRALTLESMRWALWTLRQTYPNAVCFYCNPLQRADVETQERKSLNENLVKMASRYGFNIIDQYNKSGIIKDLEIWQEQGQFLVDGLHTNTNGKKIQSNYIVSEIVSRMAY